ncbi:MAG: arginine--tRNA ligase [Campylobacterales bacterium]|nr:arginine--tRNA ligase [Campylobacterales bacterium]
MHKKLDEILKKHIGKSCPIERPKDRSFGHYATPVAFSLAKELKKSPIIIAEELKNKFLTEDIFESVDVAKGFLNFKFTLSYLNEYASWVLKNEDSFAKSYKDETILLEFVSANPTGPLHIGHARGAVFGDALLKIGKHIGYNISSEYYINDAGNQIHLLGISILLAAKEHILLQNVEYPEQYYKGEYIVDLAKEIASENSIDIFKDDNLELLSEIGKNKMLILIKQNLKDVGIVFDNFISEKSLYERWHTILEKLENNGAIYKKDDKLWLESSKFGDEKDRVVVRDNDIPTYLAGDIIYHDDKFQRNFDRYINIWGADHHGYIARVKAAVRFLGYDDDKLEIVLSQMVSLLKGGEPYKMSKRAGNFILMQDVVEDIGSDALRFIFLSKKSDTHLEFDVEDLKKQDSTNPIYYINYAHARINSIFEKSNKKISDIIDIDLTDLNEDAITLLFEALQLGRVLEDAFESRQVQKLTDYLKSIASDFHSFYNSHKVIGSENEDKYLKLFAVVATTIKVGLKLLGIKALDKM